MSRRLLAVVAAIALAPVATACSAGGSSTHKPGAATIASYAAPDGSPASRLTAVRWWSNSAATVGSPIKASDPSAAARELHRSRNDYCRMLRQTVAAGRSILPGVTAHDPALLTSTRAFVAEIEAVAPSSVAGAWRELGSAVLTFVESGGDTTKVKKVDAAAVRTAAGTVAADAKHGCGVDLSSVRTSPRH